MSNFADLSKHHTSEAAEQQLKKRRWAQWRLQAYGIAAICVAGLALVALLYTVIGNAAGVVREHYVTLPVELPADEIDPNNMIAADFSGISKDALRAYFPHVTGRTERRELNDVISNGAAFELRSLVDENNGLIGQTIDYRFLASDVTDLYLKGEYGRMEIQDKTGAITITSKDDKGFTFNADTALFDPAIRQIQRELERRAARLDQTAMQEQNGVRVFKERVETAETDEDREKARECRKDYLGFAKPFT